MQLVPRHVASKASLGGLKFLYNPTTFTDTHAVTFNEIKTPYMTYPLFVYAGAERRNVTFDIYVNDKVEDGITKKWVWHLESYLPSQNNRADVQHPRKAVFAYGWFVSDCYITNVEAKYTAFSPELQPTEATISVTIALIKDTYY
ncbi:hypothetical protein F400_gp088 [Bacillus phage BCD7]|uniref:Contractile injection system tube protein N-terminal domain-containing protein n=1 Tax=Bacillus phage BCD7 TaxID=1136534 RepID=J9PVC0_9CAUD|nr:hypothetical protein F400_gp088 [Bacillus phage BCD7]AEZ50535.1 hypothetical protein BCD7_0088 [Bacillus phage BCD7]